MKGQYIEKNASVHSYDEGLRKYMFSVYNYMAGALLTSGLVSYITAKTGLVYILFSGPLGLVVSLSPFFISIYLAAKFNQMNLKQAVKWIIIYSACMGLALSSIFAVYAMQDITRAFLITSVTFLSMSLYGYTTKKDLSELRSFLVMGLMGVIIASLVNMFMHSSALMFFVSVAAVVLFTAMTAYDTQRIKEIYHNMSHGRTDNETIYKVALFGALQLYMDFISLFIHLLHIMGSIKDRR